MSTKPTRTPNPVQVVFSISNSLGSTSANPLRGYIEVYDDLDLWHVDTSCQHVCSDDNTNLTRPELFDHLVSLLMAHLTENDCRLEVFTSHHLVQAVSETLGVDKDDSLGHLTNIEDILYEVRLLSWLTAVLKLLDVVQGKLLFFQVYLMSCTCKLCDSNLDIFSVRS